MHLQSGLHVALKHPHVAPSEVNMLMDIKPDMTLKLVRDFLTSKKDDFSWGVLSILSTRVVLMCSILLTICTVKNRNAWDVCVFINIFCAAVSLSCFTLSLAIWLTFISHIWPSLVHLQVSELVKCFNREDITVWASVSSSIMEECCKTVHEPPGGDKVTCAAPFYQITNKMTVSSHSSIAN